MGLLVVQAIQRRDYPVIQGALVVVAMIYVLVNLLVDILYIFLDPRIRYGSR
jgi:peptide/nickel transport system permease protein